MKAGSLGGKSKELEVAKVQRIKTNIPQSSGREHNSGCGSRGKAVDTGNRCSLTGLKTTQKIWFSNLALFSSDKVISNVEEISLSSKDVTRICNGQLSHG
ncbi:hypothetical protein K1719_044146, partial [Acacia pycnantha]